MEPLVEDEFQEDWGNHIQLLPSKEELNISDDGEIPGRDDSDHAQRHQRPAKYDPCYVWEYSNLHLVQWLERFFTKEMTSIDASRVDRQDYDTSPDIRFFESKA